MNRRVLVAIVPVLLFLLVAVWYVSTRPGAAPATPPLATAAAGALGAPAAAVPTAPRPMPVEELFRGCPGEGDGTDPELNRMKNRVDEGPWRPVTVQALLDLRWPETLGRKHMAQWSAADRAQVTPFNGVPVQAEGYLLQARQEGPESPNCHSAEDLDFHMWFAAQPTSDRATASVVIEMTPRIRAKHPSWTLPAFQQAARERQRLRVSGWTMLDPEHPDEVGKSRGTLWEIHPVMKVEAEQGAGWREL
jgi:hypothetical protein